MKIGENRLEYNLMLLDIIEEDSVSGLFIKEFSESIVTEMMPYILKNKENDENL